MLTGVFPITTHLCVIRLHNATLSLQQQNEIKISTSQTIFHFEDDTVVVVTQIDLIKQCCPMNMGNPKQWAIPFQILSEGLPLVP